LNVIINDIILKYKCIQLENELKQKEQTTYEHALTSTSIYGGIEPLKLAILTFK